MLQGEHSAILSTFIKLPFVIKIFVLSIFECLFKTGLTVYYFLIMDQSEHLFWVFKRIISMGQFFSVLARYDFVEIQES